MTDLEIITEIREALNVNFAEISEDYWLSQRDRGYSYVVKDNKIICLRICFKVFFKNDFSNLCRKIKKLNYLKRLDLSSNQIERIPESIFKLNLLTDLDLSNNQIERIPESIVKLNLLTELNLSFNRIWKIPESIVKLNLLTDLDLSNNPLIPPFDKLLENGIEAIQSYFKNLKEGKVKVYESRIQIVGQGFAGKTTLANKILNPEYLVSSEEDTTQGIVIHKDWSFKYLKDPSKSILANIWDYGGQEIQYMTHQFFLAPDNLYIMVINNRSEDSNIEYWLYIISLLGEKSPVLIVFNEVGGNKNSKININSYQERYKDNFLIEKIEIDLSKNDTMLKVLSEKIKLMISNQSIIGMELPLGWVSVKKEILKMKEKYISWNSFFKICRKNNINNEKDALTLSSMLHKLGHLLHFQNDSSLSDTIFLNIKWVLDSVYSIIQLKSIRETGQFTKIELFNFLEEKKYRFEDNNKLLNLLLKNQFDVCYQLKDQNKYIVPRCLPYEKPEIQWNFNNVLKYRYEYGAIMPHGIMNRLTVQLSEFIEKKDEKDLVWQTGVVLKMQSNFAKIELVTLKENNIKVIDIEISGEEYHRKELLTIIRNSIQKIHNSFKNLPYAEKIPCPKCEETKQIKVHYFDKDIVEKRDKQKKKETFECPICDEDIPLKKLLEGFESYRDKSREDDTKQKVEINIYGDVNNSSIANKISQHKNSGITQEQLKVILSELIKTWKDVKTEEDFQTLDKKLDKIPFTEAETYKNKWINILNETNIIKLNNYSLKYLSVGNYIFDILQDSDFEDYSSVTAQFGRCVEALLKFDIYEPFKNEFNKLSTTTLKKVFKSYDENKVLKYFEEDKFVCLGEMKEYLFKSFDSKIPNSLPRMLISFLDDKFVLNKLLTEDFKIRLEGFKNKYRNPSSHANSKNATKDDVLTAIDELTFILKHWLNAKY